jgi:sugar lactone lactonase YvrE
MQTHHLTVTERGEVYFADPLSHKVWLVDAAGQQRVVTGEINWPHGLRVSTDQSLLAVTDPHTRWIWSFQIQRDGSLANGQPFYHLESRDEVTETDAGGLTFDTDGFLYVATSLGVQVCDPAGRVTAILNPPGLAGTNNVFFAGPNMQWLYVTDGERVYRRPSKRRGVTSWMRVKPPQPRL